MIKKQDSTQDNTNKVTKRLKCLNDKCNASTCKFVILNLITLNSKSHNFTRFGETNHIHSPSSHCDLAIKIQYNIIIFS